MSTRALVEDFPSSHDRTKTHGVLMINGSTVGGEGAAKAAMAKDERRVSVLKFMLCILGMLGTYETSNIALAFMGLP